ncbi:hypothetical protein Tco_0908905 [Tanacetum coccineum]|uniref:Uncharacterized protein n=1 Tax=Tanacetum coccineum TaxID=301880 RepID=A0ABQ5CPK1_9ASTR
MTWFEQLKIHLSDLYHNNLSHDVDAFKHAFRTFSGEEHQTFILKMFYNLDQLRLQFERENLHDVNAKNCLEVLRTQFKEFFALQGVNSSDHLHQCWQQDFKDYTYCEPETYIRDLLKNLDILENFIDKEILHEHEIEKSFKLQSKDVQINPVQAVDANLVVICKRSGNDTNTNDADIKTTYDEEPMAELRFKKKVFVNAALKNELRKLKGNSVDTKFAKLSILGKPALQPLLNQSVVRQPNAFKSERPKFSKPRFSSQVDVKNDLAKPVTPYYLPKVQESVLLKPHHVIAPGSSRNSQEESYGSNDMAHNFFIDEARKIKQERNRNLIT